MLFLITSISGLAATCTIAVSADWSSCVCQETGSAPVSGDNVVVNSGVTLTFPSGGSVVSFTGTLTINGTVVNDKANTEWLGNVIINSGGELTLNQKLDVGAGSGCGNTIVVNGTGHISLNGSGGSDLLSICDQKVAQSGGGCGTYPTGPTPYCDPGTGFTGPFTWNQNGLPIQLLYFNVSIPKNEKYALVEWATSEEIDFDHFEIERAGSDLNFKTIAEIEGAGQNTTSVKKYTAYDENPLVGTGYYRLKAVDIDGTYEYFTVRSVVYNGNRKLLVWSNPAQGSSFKYSINFEPGPYDRVVLVNQVGAEVHSSIVKGTENELVLNSQLKPGTYLLRYVSPTFQDVARVVVKE